MLKARCTSLPEEKGRPLQKLFKQIEFGSSRIFIKHAGRPAGGKPNRSIGQLCRNRSLAHRSESSSFPSQPDGVLRHRLGYAPAVKGQAHA